jgi:hypothetical protein
MDNNGSKLNDKSELPTELELENTVETSAMWFAAAMLFACSGRRHHNLSRRQ